MSAIEKLREIVGQKASPSCRFALTAGDCAELLQEIDRMRGERIDILALQGELFEHLSLIVGYLEYETSQGDGIAEEHFDGYTAAKALLKRASERSAQWENAQLSLDDLRSETREACARICDERAKMNASMGRKALALESGACADSIRYGG